MQGRVIDQRFRLDRLVGEGAMGTVWRAEHLALGAPVAVKLIHAEAARNADALARFEREALIAAQIRSLHVVQMIDHGRDQGQPYIVMEWLEGESLQDRLAAQGRLGFAETARMVTHVCRALSQAHDAGLVHRDIKPGNIFAVRPEDGSGELYKVLDFGVAKITDSIAIEAYGRTKTGALLGTPFYLSPEQARGLKSLDFRADLWSLGVVGFECLTGQRPFRASALGPLIAKIIQGPIPVPSEVAPEARIPPEIDGWMCRALARDPAERFGSAKELAEAFRIAVGVADSRALPAAPSKPKEVGPEPLESTALLVAEDAASVAAHHDRTVALEDYERELPVASSSAEPAAAPLAPPSPAPLDPPSPAPAPPLAQPLAPAAAPNKSRTAAYLAIGAMVLLGLLVWLGLATLGGSETIRPTEPTTTRATSSLESTTREAEPPTAVAEPTSTAEPSTTAPTVVDLARAPEPARCQTNAGCEPGQICDAGRCVPAPAPLGCHSNNDCKGNRICKDGSCVFPDGCSSHLDCKGDRFCVGGICQGPIPCSDSAPCPAQATCVQGTCRKH